MTTTVEKKACEYQSGDVVEPGVYIEVDTGRVVHIHQPDELPEGQRVVRYRRRFRRLEASPPASPVTS